MNPETLRAFYAILVEYGFAPICDEFDDLGPNELENLTDLFTALTPLFEKER